jgi:signal recognition particle subunit SRP54
MFVNLRTGLRNALKKIVGASDINEEIIESLCKDVQRTLLQSDVNVKSVLEITNNLKNRALNEQPVKGLSRKDHIITILYGELAKLLGYTGGTIKAIDKIQRSAATRRCKLGMFCTSDHRCRMYRIWKRSF